MKTITFFDLKNACDNDCKICDECHCHIWGSMTSHAVLAEVRAIIDSLYGKRTDDMYSQALDDIKEKLSEHFSTDGVCFICKTPTENISSDPMKWRIDLPFYNGNGLLRQYHQGCVVSLIEQGNGG